MFGTRTRSSATPGASPTQGPAPLTEAPEAMLRRLEWRLRNTVNTALNGAYRSTFRGRGMEFDQVVRYEWGDDPRDIDWNVTARLGEPYRKKFVEERELSQVLIFEDSPALQFGSTRRSRRDMLLEVATLFMLLGALSRDRVGLLYCSPSTSWFQRPVPGRKSMMATATRLLTQAPPPLDGPVQCELPWRFLRHAIPRRSLLLWLGPFIPGERPEAWRDLQQRYQVVAVRADDPWDIELPHSAAFSAYDPVAGRMTVLNPASTSEREAHARWARRREAYMRELFPLHTDRLLINCAADPVEAISRHFRDQAAQGRQA
jgi:uncharacterized protein (DUF58 family)